MQISAEERAAGQLSEESLAKALRTFNDVGMVVLESVLEPEFIQEVRRAYDAELEKELIRRGGTEKLKGKTFGDNHVGFFPPMLHPFTDERLAANPLAVQVASKLIAKDFQCDFYHTNTALPGSGIQPLHRDMLPIFGTEFPIPVPTTALVVNIALCDFTVENGSTEYWPGTHLIVDSTAEEGKNLEARAENMASIRTNMPVGSVVLRDLRAWHRGMPNNADYPRTMFALVDKRGWLNCTPISSPNWSRHSGGCWRQHGRRLCGHSSGSESRFD